MCLYPRLIKNPKYTATKKNGGIIPPLPIINGVEDARVMMTPVGCGKCLECVKKKSREWQVRLLEEVRHNKSGNFVTLTFSNEEYTKLAEEIQNLKGYELDNEIARLAIRRFLERWRKKHKKSVRHWLVTELGHNGTENIHLHGILFTEHSEDIEKIWKYGYVWNSKKKNGYVSEKTVNYITKYLRKQDQKHKEYLPRMFTSAGIGKGYIDRNDIKNNKYKGADTDETYRTRTGHKIAMPIYYRNKIYSEEEREKLWIDKLDKQTRYVDGKEIDISKNEDKYYKALNEARKKNERLGYGSDRKNWERLRYERQRRILTQKERMKKKKNVPMWEINEPNIIGDKDVKPNHDISNAW